MDTQIINVKTRRSEQPILGGCLYLPADPVTCFGHLLATGHVTGQAPDTGTGRGFEGKAGGG